MKKIPFVKLTSCGNNFVVVDETQGQHFSETEMSDFARLATSTSFGVGCDNLLVIQCSTADNIATIASERHYWQQQPDADAADYLFRMFEPDGTEALCCGNGLICVANFLYQQHGIENARIMTEIPLSEPQVIAIGSTTATAEGWANLGYPRRSPRELVSPGTTSPFNETICHLSELKVGFRAGDLSQYTDKTELSLSGYLVFTGEPHLVVFPHNGFSVPELADYIFGSCEYSSDNRPNKRLNFGSWLVEHIGGYINGHCQDMFPAGLNVNFARITEDGQIENRCFERGINRETLACGTGALAVSYVVRHVMGYESSSLTVLPLRCLWHDPDAAIRIQQTDSGWRLSTRPVLLFEGTYQLPKAPAGRMDNLLQGAADA